MDEWEFDSKSILAQQLEAIIKYTVNRDRKPEKPLSSELA